MKKALLIVDMVNDFVDTGGALPVKGAQELISPIAALSALYRANEDLVIYTNDAHTFNDPEFKDWPTHSVKGTSGSKVTIRLDPHDGDIIIEKQKLSAFSNPKLNSILKKNKVNEITIVGVATDYCVLCTALSAASNDYKVNVVVDAIAGVDIKKGDQYRALLLMGNSGVKPIYTESK